VVVYRIVFAQINSVSMANEPRSCDFPIFLRPSLSVRSRGFLSR
jgi:hypothetical protein